jgi:hypothetical protein
MSQTTSWELITGNAPETDIRYAHYLLEVGGIEIPTDPSLWGAVSLWVRQVDEQSNLVIAGVGAEAMCLSMPNNLSRDQATRYAKDMFNFAAIFNLSSLIPRIGDLNWHLNKANLAITETFGTVEFICTGIHLSLSESCPKAPPFVDTVIPLDAFDQQNHRAMLKELNQHFNDRHPIMSWVRHDKSAWDRSLKAEYVYEGNNGLFAKVTVHHSEPTLCTQDVIAFGNRIHKKV